MQVSHSALGATASTTHPMVRDFTTLFGCQTVLLGVCGFGVLTRGSDADRGRHINEIVGGVCGEALTGVGGGGELGC